jgi:hypothetical protein
MSGNAMDVEVSVSLTIKQWNWILALLLHDTENVKKRRGWSTIQRAASVLANQEIAGKIAETVLGNGGSSG